MISASPIRSLQPSAARLAKPMSVRPLVGAGMKSRQSSLMFERRLAGVEDAGVRCEAVPMASVASVAFAAMSVARPPTTLFTAHTLTHTPTLSPSTHTPLNNRKLDAGVRCEAVSMASVASVAFAAMSVARPAANDSAELIAAVSKGVDIYLVLLTIRVIMTWFRNINWRSEPFKTLRTFTDPYLNVFRGIIPPIGGMDLSPMLGFMVLQFASRFLRKAAMGM
eukprot:gene31576-6770_t